MDGLNGLKLLTELKHTHYSDLPLTLFHKPKMLPLWVIELLLVLYTETQSDSLLTGIKSLKSKTDNKSMS
jgi:hypothetical protein